MWRAVPDEAGAGVRLELLRAAAAQLVDQAGGAVLAAVPVLRRDPQHRGSFTE